MMSALTSERNRERVSSAIFEIFWMSQKLWGSRILAFKKIGISVRPNNSVEVVISYLRDQGELPENTDKIFVVNNDNEYLGELSISTIITSNPSMIVKDIMDEDLSPLKTDQDDKEVAIIFERNDLISSAVIDENNNCLLYTSDAADE